MDKFKVSGEILREFYSKSTTLGIVFRDIERDLIHEDKIVCGFFLNGKRLNSDQELLVSNYNLSVVETLEYESEDKGIFVKDLVKTWILNIEKMSYQIRKYSNLKCLEEHSDNIFHNYYDVVDTMRSLKQLVGTNINYHYWQNAEVQTENILNFIRSNRNIQFFIEEMNNSLQVWLDCLLYIQDESESSNYFRQFKRVSH